MLNYHQHTTRNCKEVVTIKKRVFGFDIDGVLTADDNGTDNIWLTKASEYFKLPVIKQSFYIEEALGVSEQQADLFFQKVVRSIITNVTIRPYCVQVLNELSEIEAEIHLITARDEKFRDLTENWLAKHKVPYDTLHMSPGSGQKYSKGAKCVELGVEFFVDDNLENCIDVTNHGVHVVLFEASHNKGRKTNITRVSDWLDIKDQIHSILRSSSQIAR